MPADDVKMTLRIPVPLNDRLEAFIDRKRKASGGRHYSKNDAILDGIEALMDKEKAGGSKK